MHNSEVQYTYEFCVYFAGVLPPNFSISINGPTTGDSKTSHRSEQNPVPNGILYPVWSLWRSYQSTFNLEFGRTCHLCLQKLMEENNVCMLLLFIYLTINVILDLHGPEKVKCLVRYFLPPGMSTMLGFKEEQAAAHAFDNACKKWMRKKPMVNLPYAFLSLVKWIMLCILRWFCTTLYMMHTFVSSWRPSP